MVPLPPFVSPRGNGAIVEVLVQPRASREELVGPHGSALKIRVTAPPVDDKANRAVEGIVAAIVDVPRASVSVVSGHSSRRKRLAVVSASPEEVAAALLRHLP